MKKFIRVSYKASSDLSKNELQDELDSICSKLDNEYSSLIENSNCFIQEFSLGLDDNDNLVDIYLNVIGTNYKLINSTISLVINKIKSSKINVLNQTAKAKGDIL